MPPAKFFQDNVFWIYDLANVAWVVAIWVVVVNLLNISILIWTLRIWTLTTLSAMLLFVFTIHIVIN